MTRDDDNNNNNKFGFAYDRRRRIFSRFVCIWISRLVFQGSLVQFLMTLLLILSSLVYPLTFLRKRVSAASRPVMSRLVVTHVSLPYSTVGLATAL